MNSHEKDHRNFQLNVYQMCTKKGILVYMCIYKHEHVCNHVYSCTCHMCLQRYHNLTSYIFGFTKSKNKPHVLGSCNNHSKKIVSQMLDVAMNKRFFAAWGWCFQEAGFYALRFVSDAWPFRKRPKIVLGSLWTPKKTRLANNMKHLCLLIFIHSCQDLRSCIGQQIHGQSMSLQNRACHTPTHTNS